MADYGHALAFGAFVTPGAERPAAAVEAALAAEAAGLDLVGIQDHPYHRGQVDTWTLLSWISALTSRITVLPDVVNLPLRPPSVLAKSVATLDLLSGGRVELGLGAGANPDAVVAMGGPRRTGGAALAATEEAIAVMRGLWDTEAVAPLRVEGEHYRVVGAKRGPAPAHRVGIWLGAYGPQMLRLIGRAADGWLPSLGYAGEAELARGNAIIDEAAVEVGRSPRDVRRVINVFGTFRSTPPGNGTRSGGLNGPPAVWAEVLTGLALEHGFSAFIGPGDGREDMERFAAEVAPAVREAVAAERGRDG